MIQIAYLSGHFDGEGTIAIKKDPRCNHIQVQCKVTATYRPVLEKYLEYFGGSIYTLDMDKKRLVQPVIKSWKQQYMWNVTSYFGSHKFLLAVEPFLMEKRERAREALSILEGRPDLLTSRAKVSV